MLDHLPQPPRIADHRPRGSRHLHRQVELLGLGERRDRLGGGMRDQLEIDRLALERRILVLGEVEHVVDQRAEPLDRDQDRLGIIAAALAERAA